MSKKCELLLFLIMKRKTTKIIHLNTFFCGFNLTRTLNVWLMCRKSSIQTFTFKAYSKDLLLVNNRKIGHFKSILIGETSIQTTISCFNWILDLQTFDTLDFATYIQHAVRNDFYWLWISETSKLVSVQSNCFMV